MSFTACCSIATVIAFCPVTEWMVNVDKGRQKRNACAIGQRQRTVPNSNSIYIYIYINNISSEMKVTRKEKTKVKKKKRELKQTPSMKKEMVAQLKLLDTAYLGCRLR